MGSGLLVAGLVLQTAVGLAAGPDPQAPVETRAPVLRRLPELRGFSLVLVQGDMKSAAAGEAPPPAAAKALADMKDFLPFKSYALLDTTWTMGSSGTIKSQLRQSDTQTYDVELRAALMPDFITSATPGPPGNGTTVSISGFRMQKAGAGRSGGPVDRTTIENELRSQEQALEAYRQQYAEASRRAGDANKQSAAVLQAKMDDLRRSVGSLRSAADQMASQDALIDTSFRMKLGETVVVGTSRLQGDKALIVLVTAVGK